MSETSNKNLKVVELFAGVGGFSQAFKNSQGKFKTIYSNQWEPSASNDNQFAFKALQKNFPRLNASNKDIAVDKNNISKDFDLLVGGFPCQDYSVAGTQTKGIHGKKGVLWWEISWILENKNPNFLFLENVDRLLKSPSNQRGRDFAIMLKDLDEKGYNVEWMVINAADYGFVQRRRRVFILGWKKNYLTEKKSNNIWENYSDGAFTKKFKVQNFGLEKIINLNNYQDKVYITNNYDEGKFLNYGRMVNGEVICADYIPKFTGKKKVLGDILEKNVPDEFFLKDEEIEKVNFLKGPKKIERTRPNGEPYFYTEGKMETIDYPNKPARTMLTSEGTLNRSTHYVLDKNSMGHERLRRITPLEAERINGFKDNWTAEVMSEKQRYFCMGNALVVPLVRKIGFAFWKRINETKD